MQITDFNVAVVDAGHDQYLSRWVEQAGRLDLVAKWLEPFRCYMPEGARVVDVGACLGDHTVTYAQFVGTTGQVCAFEPNPEAFECLRYNSRAFPQIALYPLALGGRNGTGRLVPNYANLGNTKIIPTDSDSGVPTVKLDVIAAPWSRLDFMKIDAEGMEPEILDGAAQTISRHHPVLLMEVNSYELALRGYRPASIYERLDILGYRVSHVRPADTLEGSELDILAVPR